jgi:hypothetical protein
MAFGRRATMAERSAIAARLPDFFIALPADATSTRQDPKMTRPKGSEKPADFACFPRQPAVRIKTGFSKRLQVGLASFLLAECAVLSEWSTARRCKTWSLCLVLGVCAVLTLVPQSAKASCGDYVVAKGTAGLHTHDSAMPPQVLPFSTSPSSTLPGGPFAPCRGPNCTRAPLQAPPGPIVPAPATGGDDLVWVGNPPVIPATAPGVRIDSRCSLCPVHRPGRVERPPRPLLASPHSR